MLLMASTEDSEINFHLVSTYIPLILLMIRALLLITLLEICFLMKFQTVVIFLFTAMLVYYDAHLNKTDHLSRACGFLCPLALFLVQLLLIQIQKDCVNSYYYMSQCILDLVWAICCSSFVAVVCIKGKFPVDVTYASFISSIFCLVHACMQCAKVEVVEVVVRTCMYYFSCSLFYYLKNQTHTLDRNLYRYTIVHLFLHIFFVRMYVLIGSGVVFILLFSYVYYTNFTSQSPSLRISASPVANDQENLVRQLRAAQCATATTNV